MGFRRIIVGWMEDAEKNRETTGDSLGYTKCRECHIELDAKERHHLDLMTAILKDTERFYRCDPTHDRATELKFFQDLIIRFKQSMGSSKSDWGSSRNGDSCASVAPDGAQGGKRALVANTLGDSHHSTNSENSPYSAPHRTDSKLQAVLEKMGATSKRRHQGHDDAGSSAKKSKPGGWTIGANTTPLPHHRQTGDLGRDQEAIGTTTLITARPGSIAKFHDQTVANMLTNPLTFEDCVSDRPHAPRTSKPTHNYWMPGALGLSPTAEKTQSDLQPADQTRQFGDDMESTRAGTDSDDSGTLFDEESVAGSPFIQTGAEVQPEAKGENNAKLSMSGGGSSKDDLENNNGDGSRNPAAYSSSVLSPRVCHEAAEVNNTPPRKQDPRPTRSPASGGHRIPMKPVFESYGVTYGSRTNIWNSQSGTTNGPPTNPTPTTTRLQGAVLPMFTAIPCTPGSGTTNGPPPNPAPATTRLQGTTLPMFTASPYTPVDDSSHPTQRIPPHESRRFVYDYTSRSAFGRDASSPAHASASASASAFAMEEDAECERNWERNLDWERDWDLEAEARAEADAPAQGRAA